jgi:hypothetical protein
MSVRQSKEAWLVPLPGREKITLLAMAEHACEHCGLAWPGNSRLAEMTGLGRTALHEALSELKRMGLLAEHSYGKGGRGCSTVYQVLPGALEYCPAPCPQTRENLERPKKAVPRKLAAAQTVRKPTGNQERKPSGNQHGLRTCVNGAEIGTVRVIPSALDAETVRPPSAEVSAQSFASGAPATASATAAVRQPSGEPEPPCAHAREGPADAAAPHASSHPTPPLSVGEDLRRRCPDQRWSPAMLRSLDAIPLVQTVAVTAADRGEAQDPRHPPQPAPSRHARSGLMQPVGAAVLGIVSRATQAAPARASPGRGGLRPAMRSEPVHTRDVDQGAEGSELPWTGAGRYPAGGRDGKA